MTSQKKKKKMKKTKHPADMKNQIFRIKEKKGNMETNLSSGTRTNTKVVLGEKWSCNATTLCRSDENT